MLLKLTVVNGTTTFFHLNPECIISVTEGDGQAGSHVAMSNGDEFASKETPEEIERLVTELHTRRGLAFKAAMESEA